MVVFQKRYLLFMRGLMMQGILEAIVQCGPKSASANKKK